MSQTIHAFVVHLGPDLQAAISPQEVVEVVANAPLWGVPATPFYCRHVTVWLNRIIPVMDLGALLLDQRDQYLSMTPLVAIIAWQEASQQALQYGALRLDNPPPRVITVQDEQACELPSDLPLWSKLAHACFDEQGRAVPVLDLSHIFSRDFRPVSPR